MTINLKLPNVTELKPRITVFGVGGAGGNAVNNMIETKLEGVEFVVANTDAQALAQSIAERKVQMGTALTEGLGAGSRPEVGAAAAEEALPEILDHITGSHMVFITAGMGGGTGTGAAPVIAKAAREQGILTVGVVTKPFHFEGQRRMVLAEGGIERMTDNVDTLIVIPNQNLFRVANEKTTFADAFSMADQVLYSGVAGITDLMVKEGLINLDFADVRAVMGEMGKAMMGTGEASGEKRAVDAAEAAISNPLLDDVSMRGARGLLISITGGDDLTLFEVDEAANRIREEVDPDANIILGATFDQSLEGVMRVSVVATGITEDGGAKKSDGASSNNISNNRFGSSPLNKSSDVVNKITSETVESEELSNEASGVNIDNIVPNIIDVEEENVTIAGDPKMPRANYSSDDAVTAVNNEIVIEAEHDTITGEEAFKAEVIAHEGVGENNRNGQNTFNEPAIRETVQNQLEVPIPQVIAEEEVAVVDAHSKVEEVLSDSSDARHTYSRSASKLNDEAVKSLNVHEQKRRLGIFERLANVGANVGIGRNKEEINGEPPFEGQNGNSQNDLIRPSAGSLSIGVDPDIDDDQLEIPAFLRRQAN